MKRNQLFAVIASLLLSSAAADAVAGTAQTQQTTAFTYQGQLNAGGTLPSGQTYQFTFTLFDAVTGGNVIGTPIQQALTVANGGLFTTDLDFGQIFNGTQYWLEIKVGSTVGDEEALQNRQPINAVPVAQWALNSPAGTAGPQGPTGPVGPQGIQGAQGSTGADGAQGTPGVPGPQGLAGANGAQGSPGADGAQGPIGPQGADGNDGAQGPQGATGATGATGLNWKEAWDGTVAYNPGDAVFFGGSSYIALLANTNDEPDTSVSGSDGNWGLLAQQGATGAQGTQGTQGIAGTPGAQGAQGPAGADGAQGAAGTNGAQGAPGTNGAPGPQGPAGANGAPGPQGSAGTNGTNGTQGPQGANGADGAQGAQGATGSISANVRIGTASPGNVTAFTVAPFAALANTGYSVSLVLQGATGTIDAGFAHSGCLYNITARTTTTFTFECRAIDANAALNLNGLTFEYIVIHP